MLEMNPEVRTVWTRALRSGEYEQALGALTAVDGTNGEVRGHCCLGVLTEEAVKAGIIEAGKWFRGEGFLMYAGVTGELPYAVKDWAGLGSPDPFLTYDRAESGRISCSDANDNHRLSFTEIADLIDGGEANVNDC